MKTIIEEHSDKSESNKNNAATELNKLSQLYE